MKRIILFLIPLAMACSSPETVETEVGLGDTIQTESGLQYYYLKKGEGRRVEPGSELSSYLSLMVEDSVVWTTDDSPDSVFTFIADVSSVIKGFNEMALLLREGDDVVAILPDSLAYGASGAGDVIPPYATLVYDRFWVRKVHAPKFPMSDTLVAVFGREGIEGLKARYQQITSTSDSSEYHIGESMEIGAYRSLWQEEENEGALEVAHYFAELRGTPVWEWYKVLSYERLEQIPEAIETLEVLIQNDTTGSERFVQKLEELQTKE